MLRFGLAAYSSVGSNQSATMFPCWARSNRVAFRSNQVFSCFSTASSSGAENDDRKEVVPPTQNESRKPIYTQKPFDRKRQPVDRTGSSKQPVVETRSSNRPPNVVGNSKKPPVTSDGRNLLNRLSNIKTATGRMDRSSVPSQRRDPTHRQRERNGTNLIQSANTDKPKVIASEEKGGKPLRKLDFSFMTRANSDPERSLKSNRSSGFLAGTLKNMVQPSSSIDGSDVDAIVNKNSAMMKFNRGKRALTGSKTSNISNDSTYTQREKRIVNIFDGGLLSPAPEGTTIKNVDRSSSSYSNRRPAHHNERRRNYKQPRTPLVDVEVEIPTEITVADLAARMGIKADQLQKMLRGLGEKVSGNDHVLSADTAELACLEMNMKAVLLPPDFLDLEPTVPPKDMSHLPRRPPIVSVMGHVDHGKTTLLDSLRSLNAATYEHGGITQTIGAFTVDIGSDHGEFRNITFIDTPGHAAFSAMRQNGTEITDMIVLVIAAGDGIRPQTEEVIDLARKANVPLIIGVTKCDMFPDEKEKMVDTLSNSLMSYGVIPEAYGGDTQIVCVSGKTGEGIEDLKQAICLQSEIMDLRADRTLPGEAMVVDSTILKGMGNCIDVLVNWGTLKQGAFVVAGTEYGKIRSLILNNGQRVQSASPSTPVRLLGMKGLPSTGESLLTVKDETEAKRVIENRRKIIEWDQLRSTANVSVQELPEVQLFGSARRFAAKKFLHHERKRLMEKQAQKQASLTPGDEGFISNAVPVIFKTDALGIMAAIDTMTSTLPTDEVLLKKIHSAVGPVTSSDIDLAEATNATIFCFNVKHPSSIDQEARRKGVAIHQHTVVYHLLDDIKDLLSDNLDSVVEDVVLGQAEVLQSISINTRGRQTTNIAGCRVIEGTLKGNVSFRVLRGGEPIVSEEKAVSLKHFKEKVSEVMKGQECGVQLSAFDDYIPGDIIQSFIRKTVKRRI